MNSEAVTKVFFYTIYIDILIHAAQGHETEFNKRQTQHYSNGDGKNSQAFI